MNAYIPQTTMHTYIHTCQLEDAPIEMKQFSH